MNKFKLLVILFILFLCCGVLKRASAQAIPNLSSINVDDYSDQQIIQLLQQAQNAGLSDVELLQRAQNQGMSTTQLQKLQSRIKDIRSKQPGSTKSTDTIVMGGRKPVNRVDTLDTTSVKKDLFASLKPKIFGADIFKNKNNSFEPNLKLATPVNYIIGPDDQLNINVYGSSVVNWKLDVSPEGNINIPGAGILNVGGKTIENATSMIKSKLAANNYAIGRGTNVQVSLGNIRSIKVIMVGQLEKPGTYTLSSLATVFNALYLAGGPTENGSLRQIEIIRNNHIIRHLDVYDFLVKGSQKDNIALQDQDIVRVPTYRTRVELTGQVKIPALFEVLPGESLQDILDYAGGFTDSAYTARIIVSQISDQQRRLTDVVEADYRNYIPLRGDKYLVQSVLARYENRVTITGAVFRPGQYQLDKGLTLSQLIEKAAGIKEDAFVERGTITRLKPDNSTELISFSVRDVVNKLVTIPLQREDSVSISSIFDLRNKYKITINGSVRKPGIFAFADSMTVENLIVKAGGFAEGASPKRIEVARRINDADPTSKSSKIANVFTVDVDSQLKLDNVNFTLMPFDIVSVYSLPGYEKQKTVKVEGEVLYPGSYTIETKNEKVSDLLARAGGPTASADIEGASLKRENIAILGIDKNKADTVAIAQERTEQLNRLKKNYNSKDSTNTKMEDVQPRNNYVGIDLPGILKSPGSKIDLLLEDGDVLRVPKQQQVVRVNGEVLYPSAVVYDPDKSFKGYVLNAGGFSPNALKRGAYVVYPNGTVRGTRKFLFFNSHPDVRPGSEIYVPKKPVHVGNTGQEILGFTAGIASLAAIIFEILSLSK
jgi:protein involved in polysaccharide export with SLBB domain